MYFITVVKFETLQVGVQKEQPNTGMMKITSYSPVPCGVSWPSHYAGCHRQKSPAQKHSLRVFGHWGFPWPEQIDTHKVQCTTSTMIWDDMLKLDYTFQRNCFAFRMNLKNQLTSIYGQEKKKGSLGSNLGMLAPAILVLLKKTIAL